MTVYEDDPRVKPKRKNYGGSTNRGSAPRGPLQKSNGSTSGDKKDPRLPAAPKQKGKDRLDFDKLPEKPAPETRVHYEGRHAGPFIDSGIRDLMRVASPLTRWMVNNDEKKSGSHPSLKDWLAGEKSSTEMGEFKRGGKGGGSQDQGIRANPQGRIPRKPPQTKGKFGPGHLPPRLERPPTPEEEQEMWNEFKKFMDERNAAIDRGLKT